MNEEQLRYLLQLINSGQGINSGYQPPSILDVPTGSAQLAPGTGPGGRGILQSDVNQAIQTQPNVDVPPDIPAVSSSDTNQRFTNLMQLYTGDPSGLLASNEPAGQVSGDPYNLPPANPGSTPTTAPDLAPGLGGPGSYPSDVTLPPGSGISIPSGDPLTFEDLLNLNTATGPGGTANYPTDPPVDASGNYLPNYTTVAGTPPDVPLVPPPGLTGGDPITPGVVAGTVLDPNDQANMVNHEQFPGGNLLTDAAGNLVDTAGNIIQAAGSFFKNAAGQIVNATGNIIQGVENFFTNNPAGYQPPPGTTLGETGPLNEGVRGSVPGETLPSGLFEGLGSPLQPVGGVNIPNMGGYRVSEIDRYTTPEALDELRRWMEGHYTTPTAFGQTAAQAPNPFSNNPFVGAPPSFQQLSQNEAYWGNIFRDRGYVLPPAAKGTPNPNGPNQTVARGTPPHASV